MLVCLSLGSSRLCYDWVLLFFVVLFVLSPKRKAAGAKGEIVPVCLYLP